MAGLNRDARARAKGIEIAVRIGIATGIVMVGEMVGEGMAQERTVIGEAPNMAARLQSLARRNGIVVGALTKEIAGDAFVYQDLGAHELKGIAGLVKAWGVIGLTRRRAPRRRRPTSGAAPPALVGRDEEIGLLRRAWQSTKDEGRGQVVLISGEAGIGKSVLVDGLRAEVRAEGLPRIAFRCSPYHTNSALYPVIEHLKRLLRWQPGDPAETRLEALEAMLGGYSQPLAEVVPLFASLLSLPLPEGRYPPLDAEPAAAEAADPGRADRLDPGGGRAPADAGGLGGPALGRPVDAGAARPADRAGADRAAADGAHLPARSSCRPGRAART